MKDWSSGLSVSSQLALQVAYYNELLAVWEPLVEPVEDGSHHRPWELNVDVIQNATDLTDDSDDVVDVIANQPPRFTVNVKSVDILQATITKTSLDVIGKLSKVDNTCICASAFILPMTTSYQLVSVDFYECHFLTSMITPVCVQSFSEAYNLVEVLEKPGEFTAPYVIKNDAGFDVQLRLDDTFEVHVAATSVITSSHNCVKVHTAPVHCTYHTHSAYRYCDL